MPDVGAKCKRARLPYTAGLQEPAHREVRTEVAACVRPGVGYAGQTSMRERHYGSVTGPCAICPQVLPGLRPCLPYCAIRLVWRQMIGWSGGSNRAVAIRPLGRTRCAYGPSDVDDLARLKASSRRRFWCGLTCYAVFSVLAGRAWRSALKCCACGMLPGSIHNEIMQFFCPRTFSGICNTFAVARKQCPSGQGNLILFGRVPEFRDSTSRHFDIRFNCG